MEQKGDNMKKVCMIIFLYLFTIVLSGCHVNHKKNVNYNNEFIVPNVFDESLKHNIVFWAKNDTNSYQKAIYNKAISDFEKIYPNIKVTMKSYTDYKIIYKDVITNISTNSTPNVCITYPDHVATYLEGNGVVVDLTNLMNDSKYGMSGDNIKFNQVSKDEIIDKYINECFFNNGYYILPFMRSTEACYVNVDYVTKLGFTLPEVLTWDFVWEVSKKAMEEKEPSKVLIPVITNSTDNLMVEMLMQKGYNYAFEDGSIDLFNDNTKSILYDLEYAIKNKLFSTFKYDSYPGNYFNAGECIFAIDSTAGATWMGSNSPLCDIPKEKVVDFETKVMAIPQYDINNKKMISQGPSLCVFRKSNPQEVLASWLFVQFMLTNDVQIGYAKSEGYVPVTKRAQESQDYHEYLSNSGKIIEKKDEFGTVLRDKNGNIIYDNSTYYSVKIDASKLVLDNVLNQFTTPCFNGSTILRNVAGNLIEDLLVSIKKNEIIDQAYYNRLFKEAKRKVNNKKHTDISELGSLPTGSIVLLVSMGVVWAGIGVYSLIEYKKKKKL